MGRSVVIVKRSIQADRRVTPSPPVVVVAQIGKRGEEPGGQLGVRAQVIPVLVKPNKCFGDQIICVGRVLDVAPGKCKQRPLPAGDQSIQRAIVSIPQCLQPGLIAVGVGVHGEGFPAALVDNQWRAGLEDWTQESQVLLALPGRHHAGSVGNQMLR